MHLLSLCVRYTGGATPFPTYRRINDHTESVQVSTSIDILALLF